MKKRLIALFLLALMTLTLFAGCSKEKPAGDRLAEIKARGTIIVAMEGTWSPWTYHDESGKLVGYDVEVAAAIAQKLGVKPEYVEGEWDGLLGGLDAGRYDMMVNGVTITDERRETYNFSMPYAYNKTAVVVNAANDSITKMEDLQGKNTANTISSTYAAVAEQYGATVTGVDDLNQTFELLLSGRIDATLNDEVVYVDYMKAHPDAPLKIACFDTVPTTVGIPVRKDASSDSLLAAIDQALSELAADGTLSALAMKYFGTDLSKAQ